MVKVDRKTVIQILGTLMQKPSLLSDTDKYQLEPSDFSMPLDRYIYSAIYNLYAGGAEKIRTVDIDTYLQSNEAAAGLIQKENGIAFMQDCEAYCEPENFNYYYNRFKKFALLRELEKSGQDISGFYCEDLFNPKSNEINDKFEKMTPTDIIKELKGKMAVLENKYSENQLIEEGTAFDGTRELIKKLQIRPEVGIKLQGEAFNTITRGGRKGTLYLRSAGSGIGKSRTMVADACQIAYPIRYDRVSERWEATGVCEPVLYIMTEQDFTEIQTMILAYLTDINEERFLYGTFGEEHMDRINKALDIMERYKDNFLFVRIPDPCSSLVKNVFHKYSFQKGVEYFFYDYIFSSPAMLNEFRDLKIREDVALRLFTTCLKNLAIELDAFIMTATQVSNNDEKTGGFMDFRNVQGSRAIINLVDFACIMSRPTPEELKMVDGFRARFNYSPNLVTDVFKNRRGRWTMCRIWSYMDLGTLRRHDLFVTTPDNKIIEEFQIIDFKVERTKEMDELEECYNNGVVTDEHAQELISAFVEKYPTQFANDIEEAFGNQQERRKMVHEMDFEDLI